jgi:hypothetical protein
MGKYLLVGNSFALISLFPQLSSLLSLLSH